jgi:hypothetical protein
MLSRYLPKASNKDKDHEDEEWVGKDRFKHYPYVREAQIWGSGEFVKLVCSFLDAKVQKTSVNFQHCFICHHLKTAGR